MTKKYFGISKPLMVELLKMYWYVPVFSFVLYFFTGIFPILTNIRKPTEIDYYVSLLMSNQNLAYVGLLTVIPLVSAVLMMSFIHNEAKALTLHSQPISKGRLFDTRYLGGWIMCVIPVIINAIIYLCLCSFKKIPYEYGILGASGVFNWILSSIAVITFLYGIYILAGTFTGSTTMHIMTSGVLFAIFPLMIGTTIGYLNTFLHGWYETPQWIYDLIWCINPIGKLLVKYESISAGQAMVYILIGILMYLAAKWIYSTRKLELVGTSMLSKTFEKLMTYAIVFMGMCVFGFLVLSFSSSKLFMVIGMSIGILFTFAVLNIILNRSFKCFEKSMIKSLAICFAIGAVFVAFTIFDIGGYSKKVPHAEDIKSVEIYDFVLGYNVSGFVSGDVPNEYYDSHQILTSDASIESVRNLHQYIIDEKLYEEQDGEGVTIYAYDGTENNFTNETINIVYNLKDGSVIKRSYDIYLTPEAVELIDEVLSGVEYKESIKLENRLKLNKIRYIEIEQYASDEYYYNDGFDQEVSSPKITIEDPKLIKGLIRAMDNDIANYGYSSNNPFCVGYIAEVKVFFNSEDTIQKKEELNINESSSSSNLINNAKEESLAEESFLWLEIRQCDTYATLFLAQNGLIKPEGYF